MSRVLLISVRFHDGRYHGAGDWPPAPSRLFQALVAGVGQDGPLTDELSRPLEWLEKLGAPPVIAAPLASPGKAVDYYVPNNDLDAVKGDLSKIGQLRTKKTFKPMLFDQVCPVRYAWHYEGEEGEQQAAMICACARRLYQLGRGIDLAWADPDIISSSALEELLAAYRGAIHRPSDGGGGTVLLCPQPGSLQSLKDRHAAMGRRFQAQGEGKSVKWRFTQPPRPLFRPVAYECPPRTRLFDVVDEDGAPFAFPLHRIAAFVTAARDGAGERLRSSHSDRVERHLIGRTPDSSHVPHDQRIRLIPLPSIGSPHADHGIRRLLVEVPAGCPLAAEDVFWAFSGLPVEGSMLTPASDMKMLRHYGIRCSPFKVWRTISPIALPLGRRRIDPRRLRDRSNQKAGDERAGEQQRAAAELVQAIRHAGVATRPDSIRLQREPFHARGERIESFAPGTRFPKERLWHAEIAFTEDVSGPLLLGDGRYCGLGLLAPADA